MKLPNFHLANIPSEKITHYLLDISHEEGRGKAIFFLHFGFSVAKWEQLAEALLAHANEHDVVKEEATIFGIRYVIESELETPSGESPRVRVVWFVSRNDPNPRLVTAYALEERDA